MEDLLSVPYEDLPDRHMEGVFKGNYRGAGGKLRQVYTAKNNHVCVLAATRQGKTTSYVIPAVLAYAIQADKRHMIITDPKGEIYRDTAPTLQAQGYRVQLLNFRDVRHSEFWNPLTPIFRRYMEYLDVYGQVEPRRDADGVLRLWYKGRFWTDQRELDEALEQDATAILDDVEGRIDDLAVQLVPLETVQDPTWELGSRDLVKAILLGMLEDVTDMDNRITEDTYSLDTMTRIALTFGEHGHGPADGGYFTRRGNGSRALQYAKSILLDTCDKTRSSYTSVFFTKIREFREATVRRITQTSTIDFSEFTDSSDSAAPWPFS